MQKNDFFRLNGIDVGFSDDTDVRVCCGALRMRLRTPAMRLTPEMAGGLLAHAWRPIENFFMAQGLAISAYEDIELPRGAYGHTFRFPQLTSKQERIELHVSDGQACPNFFGDVTVEAGRLIVIGVLSYVDELPQLSAAMPIHIERSFEPLPLIPPRKRLTLKEALALPPDEVFHLMIDRDSQVRDIPKEIFKFKNIESLWICRGQDTRAVPLHEEFFSLTQLHSLNLQWANLSISDLSPGIGALIRLETLRLTANKITSLPKAMQSLTRLTHLDVSYNALTSLPECLGELPNLQWIEAEGNRFTSLPKNLARIKRVNVNFDARELYRDIRYASSHTHAVNEAQFTLATYPTLFNTTCTALDSHSKETVLNEAVLALSSYAVYATQTVANEPVALGASKTGGAPHLPKGMAHPRDANGLFPTFYAQLNLPEIAALQSWLPRRGMLYFYLGDFRDGGAPYVIYVDTTAGEFVAHQYSSTSRWINSDVDAFNDDDPPNIAPEALLHFSVGPSLPYLDRTHAGRFPPLASIAPLAAAMNSDQRADRLRITHTEDAIESTRQHLVAMGLLPSTRAHSLNAHLWCDGADAREQAAATKGGYAHEWIHLLTLESVHDFCFGDAGYVSFCIHQQDLAAADFSNVVCVVSG